MHGIYFTDEGWLKVVKLAQVGERPSYSVLVERLVHEEYERVFGPSAEIIGRPAGASGKAVDHA